MAMNRVWTNRTDGVKIAALCVWIFLAAMLTTKSSSCQAFSLSSSSMLCFHLRGSRSHPITIIPDHCPLIDNIVQNHHGSNRLPTTRLNIAPQVLIGGGIVIAGVAGWLYIDGADDRQQRQQRQDEEARYSQYQEERARQAYVEPKDFWVEAELAKYDGTKNPDGPILMAADGLVFNVYKGRNFYGPGGEYHLFAGRDATRFLAKTIVEEETPEEAAKPLTMAERAALAAWMFTFKGKYEIVGKLDGFDPKTTSMKSLGS